MNKWVIIVITMLRYGQQLDTAEEWKKKGAALAAVTAILSAIVASAVGFGWISDQVFTIEDIASLAGAIVTVVNLVLAWTFVATDRNIGVGKREPKGKDDVQAAKGNFGELD